MTPTHKERLLTDILAALLRIEALMQREKVADTATDTVKFYQRLLEKQAKERAPDHTRWVPPLVPGMPDPPLPRVYSPRMTGDPVPPSGWTTCGEFTGTTTVRISDSAPKVKLDGPNCTTAVNKANAPSLNQGRFMHGGWIHATGFSMVGP